MRPRYALSLVFVLNWALDGATRVPDAELAAEARRFFVSPEFHRVTVNREGSALAMIKRVEGKEFLSTYDLVEGRGLQQETGDSIDVFSFGWIDNQGLLAGYANWDRYFNGLYAMDRDFKRFREVGRDREDPLRKVMNAAGGAGGTLGGREGRVLVPADTLPYVENEAILWNQSSRPYWQLMRFDRQRWVVRSLTSPDEDIVDMAFDLKGQFRLRELRGESANVTVIQHRETEEGPWEELSLPADRWFHGFDSSGRVLYVSYPEEGKRVMRGFDVVKKEFTRGRIADPIYSLEPSLIRDTESGALLGIAYEADKPVARYFDQALIDFMGMVERSLPEMAHRFVGPHAKGGFILESWGDRFPYRLSRFNPESGGLELIGAMYQGMEPETLGRMHPFVFENRGGESIRGYYTLPARHADVKPSEPLPTVVLVHGGPRARDRWEFHPEVQFYARLGYAVLQVNYRGSSSLYEARDRSLLDACVEGPQDVIDATRWAIAEGIADPARIGIAGWSFGGFIALAAVAEAPELYQCAVGAGGVYDFDRQIVEMMRDPYRRTRIEWNQRYFGNLESRSADYAAVSPIHRADQVNVPVYLLHGGADRTVYRSQSTRMESALRAAGAEVQIDTPIWLGHGALNEDQNIRYNQRIFRFLEKHLGSAR